MEKILYLVGRQMQTWTWLVLRLNHKSPIEHFMWGLRQEGSLVRIVSRMLQVADIEWDELEANPWDASHLADVLTSEPGLEHLRLRVDSWHLQLGCWAW